MKYIIDTEDEKLVEARARAICEADLRITDTPVDGWSEGELQALVDQYWREWTKHAVATLKADEAHGVPLDEGAREKMAIALRDSISESMEMVSFSDLEAGDDRRGEIVYVANRASLTALAAIDALMEKK